MEEIKENTPTLGLFGFEKAELEKSMISKMPRIQRILAQENYFFFVFKSRVECMGDCKIP